MSKLFEKNLEKDVQVSTNAESSLCELCNKLLSLKSTLKQQLTDINGELYPCEACKEKVNLQDYSQIYTGEKPYSCEICGMLFRDKQYLQKHLLIHTAETPLTYSKSFADTSSTKNVISNNADEKFYKCETCNKFFKIKACFEKHVQFHTGVAPNVCTICDRSFIRKNSLTIHMRTHTNENKKSYTCEICNESFTKRSLLINHIQCYHIKEKNMCETCGMLFKEKQELQEHSLLNHTPNGFVVCNKSFVDKCKLENASNEETCNKSFKQEFLQKEVQFNAFRRHICVVCDLSFFSKNSLTVHMHAHIKEEKKSFACDVCNESFNVRGHVINHIRRYHTKVKPYVCSICKFSCTYKRSLKYHMHVSHNCCLNQDNQIQRNQKPHACGTCKLFKNKKSSPNHIIAQSSKEFYVCDVCNRKFGCKSSLRDHVLRIHLKEARFLCEVCNKSFCTRNYLKKHLRLHTGEKPYVCDECNQSFTLKCSLMRHMRIHEREKPVCTVCGRSFIKKTSLRLHMRIHAN